MTRPVALLVSALLAPLAACGGLVGGADGADGLSGAERRAAEGWVELFDGETLDGWRGFNRADAPRAWSVEDGALTFTPGTDDGGDLMAEGVYGDFELELEWNVGACGNSGVFYAVEEGDGLDAPWRTGLEMQVLDDACHPDGKYPSHRAGALYDLYVPLAEAARPAGDWNRARIVVRDGRIEHWLNGQQLVDAEMGTDDWRARIAASKFRDAGAFPAYGTRQRGRIGVQDHGDPVAYRNIRIRAL